MSEQAVNDQNLLNGENAHGRNLEHATNEVNAVNNDNTESVKPQNGHTEEHTEKPEVIAEEVMHVAEEKKPEESNSVHVQQETVEEGIEVEGNGTHTEVPAANKTPSKAKTPNKAKSEKKTTAKKVTYRSNKYYQ